VITEEGALGKGMGLLELWRFFSPRESGAEAATIDDNTTGLFT